MQLPLEDSRGGGDTLPEVGRPVRAGSGRQFRLYPLFKGTQRGLRALRCYASGLRLWVSA
jgi:hypothetical protein